MEICISWLQDWNWGFVLCLVMLDNNGWHIDGTLKRITISITHFVMFTISSYLFDFNDILHYLAISYVFFALFSLFSFFQHEGSLSSSLVKKGRECEWKYLRYIEPTIYSANKVYYFQFFEKVGSELFYPPLPLNIYEVTWNESMCL